MRAVFLVHRQPASAVGKWTSSMQAAGISVRHYTCWYGPGDIGRRQNGGACNVDPFLLGSGATVESHVAQYASGDGLLLVSVDLQQHLLPRSGVVLLVWQPQVPQDIVTTCLALPANVADGAGVRGLLLVDPSPSLTLSVTHKALESAGLHSIARKPTVLVPRTTSVSQAAVQALLQLADVLPAVSAPPPEPPRVAGGVRIAVARDDAFGPCFQENLVLLQQAGAQLLFFSPLYDTAIPAGVACLYLSSGTLEPERWQQLANNRPLLASVRAFCDAGGLVLAEGAGLIYMSRSVDLDEDDGAHKHRVYDMAAVLPFKARLLPEPQTAAVQLRVSAGNPLLQAGSQPRGYLCSHADLVLVEERPLQSLGLFGRGGGPGGKGAQVHLSTTYEVTVVSTARRNSESGGGERTGPEGDGESPQPEGYTLQNVLASSCFVYLPSVPGLAAHLVRRCACIDVTVLATGMAHHLTCSNAGMKSLIPASVASAAGSRAGSRRQSIQDVSALCAAYGSNGGGVGGGLGAPIGLLGASGGAHVHHAGNGSQHVPSPPGQFPSAALPPRGPSCTLSSSDSGAACTAPPTCMPSPRQASSQLPHSSSSSSSFFHVSAQPRRSGTYQTSDLPPGLLGNGKYPHDVAGCPPLGTQGAQALVVPETHLTHLALAMNGDGRASQDRASVLQSLSGLQCSPLRRGHSGTSPLDRAASPSPCAVQRKASYGPDANAATEQGARDMGLAADLAPIACESPMCLVGTAATVPLREHAGRSSALGGLERSSSCSTSNVMASALTGEGLGGVSWMQHAASAGSLPSYGFSSGALGPASSRQSAGFCQGAAEEVGPSYAPSYGLGSSWAGPTATALLGGPGWSPGLATSGWSHSAVAAYGPLGASSTPSHGGVVCCAPGACEAIVAMGLANRLAGIGFDCDHPPDVCASRRVVIRWAASEEVPQGPAARGILVVRPCAVSMANHGAAAGAGVGGGGRCGKASDDRIGARGGRVLLLDELALRQEPPSVLVLPDVAELTDVEHAQLEKALVDTGLCGPGGGSGGSCTLLHVSCRSLVDVMDMMLEMGSVAGEPQAASMLLERLQARLRRVSAAAAAPPVQRLPGSLSVASTTGLFTGAGGRAPRVLVLQSLNPLVEPGRWVPEMLSMVGATACQAVPGGPDVQLSWQDLRERAAPDVLIILTPPVNTAPARAAPGHPGTGTVGDAGSQASDVLGCVAEQLSALAAQPGWWCLPAVRVSQVYLMQASFCVRPGPRLVDGVELLARLLLPGQYTSSRKVPAGAVMRLSLAAGQRCRATLLSSYFVPVVFG